MNFLLVVIVSFSISFLSYSREDKDQCTPFSFKKKRHLNFIRNVKIKTGAQNFLIYKLSDKIFSECIKKELLVGPKGCVK